MIEQTQRGGDGVSYTHCIICGKVGIEASITVKNEVYYARYYFFTCPICATAKAAHAHTNNATTRFKVGAMLGG
jgi:hypothetical protein